MELRYFHGLQTKIKFRPQADGKAYSFSQSTMYLAGNRNRRPIIANYVKGLKGSIVVICPTNDMCSAVSNMVQGSTLCNLSMTEEERKEAMEIYNRNGILVITEPAFISMVMNTLVLRSAQNLVFTSYTYFSNTFIQAMIRTGVQVIHQIVDNVPLRGVLKETYTRLGRVTELTEYDDYEDYTNFE